jgi:hypothetical protein
MHPTVSAARFTGVLYLVAGMLGVFTFAYLPALIVVPGDAAATAGNVASHLAMYRLGIVADVAGQVFLAWLSLAFYDMLSPVDRRLGRLMVVLAVTGAIFEIANVLNLIAAAVLLSHADFLAVFSREQLEAGALAFLKVRSGGLFVAQAFWGLWLLPLGLLVVRSAFFPTVIGWLLMAACFAYLAASSTHFLWPAHARMVALLMQPVEGLGEGAMVLWLLVRGVKQERGSA